MVFLASDETYRFRISRFDCLNEAFEKGREENGIARNFESELRSDRLREGGKTTERSKRYDKKEAMWKEASEGRKRVV
jgi:hypothetical protein